MRNRKKLIFDIRTSVDAAAATVIALLILEYYFCGLQKCGANEKKIQKYSSLRTRMKCEN